MTLTQLRYLLAIVDANLNITLASERVHTTQPGISKQLKLLEEELGLQIFIRRGKSLVRISPAGEQVIERARVIVAEAANIRSLAANERRENAGELVIATTQTQARFVLPRALKQLKSTWPNVSVRLNLFADAVRSLSAGQDADLLIASAITWPETSGAVIPLYHWRRVAVVPRGHPLAGLRRPLTLAELARYPLIGYETALGSHASVAAAFKDGGAPAQFAYAAHDTEVIKTYVRTGLGVGLMAEMTSQDDDLVRLAVDGLPVCTTFALLSRDRVARDYVIDFLASLAPHISRRDLVRAVHPGDRSAAATGAPDWAEWLAQTDGLAATNQARRAAGAQSDSPSRAAAAA
jgi:LysR family cys regulon transcriptional activator